MSGHSTRSVTQRRAYLFSCCLLPLPSRVSMFESHLRVSNIPSNKARHYLLRLPSASRATAVLLTCLPSNNAADALRLLQDMGAAEFRRDISDASLASGAGWLGVRGRGSAHDTYNASVYEASRARTEPVVLGLCIHTYTYVTIYILLHANPSGLVYNFAVYRRKKR